MAINLVRLAAKGPGKVDAEVVFHEHRSLVRGPSDTGKSHIRECLGYLLGGERPLKRFPENEGYDSLALEFVYEGALYTITKAFSGGSVRITKVIEASEPEIVDEDIGEFLVRLSGAAGKQILRSKSRKGPVTGGDLRHWFLISQTDFISENPTTGVASSVDRIQRAAAFYVFLTGMDDEAIVLAKTKAERDSISGQILAAETAIARAGAGIPPNLTKAEVIDSLEKVDEALKEITRQYEARAEQLRVLRRDITTVATELQKVERLRMQSQAMVHRFDLLGAKYQSDLERLGAADEGIAYFEALKTVPCPLCNTPIEQHIAAADLRPSAPGNYRAAILAEVAKIRALEVGLRESRAHEALRVSENETVESNLRISLTELERRERVALRGLRVEFSSDPTELAFRRSDLSSQLNLFEEIERLQAEIERLKKTKSTKATPVLRAAVEPGADVSRIAHGLLTAWGFTWVTEVALDLETCDLIVNGRSRLSYGSGRRSICLAALSIAMLQNSLTRNRPHIGFVVIDSPLKAYKDPKNREATDASLVTVRDNFYTWLSKWSGPGQVIVLENEDVVDPGVAATLKPIEFSGPDGEGRAGFYPAVAKSLG